MRIKTIFFTLTAIITLAFFTVEAAAQNKFEHKKVDFDMIQYETLNNSSPYYYQKLVKSFNSNDTIMNFEAYRYLYYGFLFQEDYNPFRSNEFEGKSEVEKLYYEQNLTRDDCNKIENYAVQALNDNMFDIDQITYYIYALKQKKKFARAAVRQHRLEKLIEAIMSSGYGTKEDPWVVIFPEHEYTLINFLGYVAVDHQELPGGIDYIKAYHENDKRKTKDFYFDVSRMLKEAARKFPEDFE